MKTHELYKNIASILTQKNSEELFDYIVHSMDYHGSFLRSRYCYWENVIPDIDCSEIATVLLSLKVSLPGGSFEILPAVNNLRRNNPIKRRNKRLTDFLQSNNEE